MFNGSSILANRFFGIAESYENGDSWFFSKDIEVAIGWYLRAVEYGHPKASFRLGNIYEKREVIDKALKYYLESAIKEDHEAISALQRLSNAKNITAKCYLAIVYESKGEWLKAIKLYTEAIVEKNTLAMYRLGMIYQVDRKNASGKIVVSKNISAELSWYRKAASIFSAHALNALIELSSSNGEAAFYIAEMYEKGEGLSEKIDKAIEFYKKADQLQHAVAPFRLGKLLIKIIPKASITTVDITTILQFYLTAVQRKYSLALEHAVKLVEQNSYNKHAYQLAEFFEKNNDISNALHWYMKAAHWGEKTATKRIKDITKGSREHSLFVADAYQKGSYGIKSSKQAYYYYAIAAYHGEERALVHLKTLAKEGNDQAQYALGVHYYHTKQEFDQAIAWCLRAAKQENGDALRYLNETDFPITALIEFAKMYERGNSIVEANLQKAHDYYEKAWRKGDTQAAYSLGRMALDYPQDPDQFFNQQAWDYFLAAAKKGNQLALFSLEKMALMAPSYQQKQLSDVYTQVSTLFHSHLQVLKWPEKTVIVSSAGLSTALRATLPPPITSSASKIPK